MFRRILVIGCALVAMVSSSTVAAASSPEAPAMRVQIKSLFDGRCLDVDINGNGANGSKVQVWRCNGTTQQRWIYTDAQQFESVRFPGRCLDADTNGGGANGTKIQLWQCNGSAQQGWHWLAGDLAIYNNRYNDNRNIVLDRHNAQSDGAKVQLWRKNFQSQQWWQVELS